jgi:YD repeat-containing protein
MHAPTPPRQPHGFSRAPRSDPGPRRPRVTGAGSTAYTYDAQGRTAERRTRAGTWRFTWDAEDRMTGAVAPNGTAFRYVYDPLGRRAAKQRLARHGTSVAEETVFTWDGTTLCEQTHALRVRRVRVRRHVGDPDLGPRRRPPAVPDGAHPGRGTGGGGDPLLLDRHGPRGCARRADGRGRRHGLAHEGHGHRQHDLGQDQYRVHAAAQAGPVLRPWDRPPPRRARTLRPGDRDPAHPAPRPRGTGPRPLAREPRARQWHRARSRCRRRQQKRARTGGCRFIGT